MDERFNAGEIPYGWFTEGWSVNDGSAQTKAAEMDISSLLGGGGDKQTYYLLTPPVEVKEGEKLAFSAKSGSGGMGAMMGGSSSTTFILEKSVYGSNQWEQVKDYKDDLTADYQTFEVTDVAAGEYRFRFTAGGGVNIDSVAGFHIDGDAPDLYVTVDSAVVRSINMGAVEADFSKTIYVINTGGHYASEPVIVG